VEHGHNVHTDATWVSVFDGGNGLAQPVCVVVEFVEYDDGWLVHGGSRGGIALSQPPKCLDKNSTYFAPQNIGEFDEDETELDS
jgi:hypothetical protein